MLQQILAEGVIGVEQFIRPTESIEFEQQAGKLLNVVDTDPPQKGRNPVPRYTERRGERILRKEGRYQGGTGVTHNNDLVTPRPVRH